MEEIGRLEEAILRNHLEFVCKIGDFTIGEKIAETAADEVLHAKQNATGKECAMKRFHAGITVNQMSNFCSEINTLTQTKNPFIVPLVGFICEPVKSLITEYVPNRSLFEFLRNKNEATRLSATNKTIIAMGVAYGMRHLHDLNIVHRDIKSPNILLDKDLLPKICDFGQSFKPSDGQGSPVYTVGTLRWKAPEIFDHREYGKEVDVYSYGIVLWEMLTEDLPFKNVPERYMGAEVRRGTRPPMPESAPQSVQSLIRKCWSQKREERPTFAQIYESFEKHEVAFGSSDQQAVEDLKRKIKEAEERKI